MKNSLKAGDIVELVKVAYLSLKSSEEEINELNVFPVPDGDTGTNLRLTMEKVVEEIQRAPTRMDEISKAIIYGALRGARGNSGVILSQILRGFFDEASQKEELFSDDIISSLKRAKEVAYQAVRKPVEGTMLTVIKDTYRGVKDLKKKETPLIEVLEKALSSAKNSLRRTPEYLPILKEAGVVDAGGFGLVVILEGITGFLRGEGLRKEELVRDFVRTPILVEESSKFQYCTEFLMRGGKINRDEIEEELEALGDSIVVAGDERQVRIHVHTNEPDKALACGLRRGEITEVKINNMWEEIEKRASLDEKPKLLAVATGEGIKDIFKSLGVEIVVNGGQSMNPSSSEILEALKQLKSKKAIVLPNNKNVILTCEQAQKLSDKEVYIVPTATIPQGISAAVAFREGEIGEVTEEMKEAASEVKSGEVTRAVRDANLGKEKIKKGDFLALVDGEIISTGKNVLSVFKKTLEKMVSEEDSVITVFYNDELRKEEMEKVKKWVENKFPHCELEIKWGGQPLYPLIFSIE
jgi:hypothetical protein